PRRFRRQTPLYGFRPQCHNQWQGVPETAVPQHLAVRRPTSEIRCRCTTPRRSAFGGGGMHRERRIQDTLSQLLEQPRAQLPHELQARWIQYNGLAVLATLAYRRVHQHETRKTSRPILRQPDSQHLSGLPGRQHPFTPLRARHRLAGQCNLAPNQRVIGHISGSPTPHPLGQPRGQDLALATIDQLIRPNCHAPNPFTSALHSPLPPHPPPPPPPPVRISSNC